MSFLKELKRRDVLRLSAYYVVASWLLIQVAEAISPMFAYGDSPARLGVILLAIGTVPVLIFSHGDLNAAFTSFKKPAFSVRQIHELTGKARKRHPVS